MQAETRRHAILEHFKDNDPGSGRDAVHRIMVMPAMCMSVTVAMMMLAAA